MRLSRPWSVFLLLAGLFNVAVWPRFAVAIWNDERAWSGSAVGVGSPTTFLWVHAVLIISAVLIGLGVLLVGIKGLLGARRLPVDAATAAHSSGNTPSR